MRHHHFVGGNSYIGADMGDESYLADFCTRLASHDPQALGVLRALAARTQAGDSGARAAMVRIANCARRMSLQVGGGGTYVGFGVGGVLRPLIHMALSPVSWALWLAGKGLNIGANLLSKGSHAAGSLAAKAGHAVATPVAMLGTKMQSPATILPMLPHVP